MCSVGEGIAGFFDLMIELRFLLEFSVVPIASVLRSRLRAFSGIVCFSQGPRSVAFPGKKPREPLCFGLCLSGKYYGVFLFIAAVCFAAGVAGAQSQAQSREMEAVLERHFGSDLKADGLTLENSAIRLTVDHASGCISSLYSKTAKAEMPAPGSCGNELQAFRDLPKNFDAWNIDPGTIDQPPTKLDTADSVELVEKGPLRTDIRVSRTWQQSKFVQDIVLYAGEDHAVIENDIDGHETHILLKEAFTLAATSGKATYEIPYGSIERPTSRGNSREKARFEVPALRSADPSARREVCQRGEPDEKAEGSPLSVGSDAVRVPIHPFEILTVEAVYDSAAGH
jgi:hypothetical protein